MNLLTLPDSLIPNALVFGYGLATGIFFAACVYMVIFAISQFVMTNNRSIVLIFIYAAISTAAFGLFNMYCMPLHFPQMNHVIPDWLQTLGKYAAPIGIFAFIKMFMRASPMKTLRAFLFWHRSRYIYFGLFALSWLTVFAFFFIDSRQTVIVISFALFVLNAIVGVAFASTALESKRLRGIYAALLSTVIVILSAMIYVIAFVDLSQLPAWLFLSIHTVLGLVILLLTFVVMRYTIDETMRYASVTKVEVEDFYKHMYHALQHNEFFLEYQPKVDLRTHQVNGMEALIRWDHPKKGRITPDGFINAAEQTEIIDNICQWVIKKVISDTKALLNQGIELPVSINFSVNNIHPNMVNFLLNTIEDEQLPSDMIIVEITESLFLHMSAEQKRALEMLHDAGISLSLDDFGAGFSSLRHLDEMGLSEIKIDKSFALNLSDSKKHTVVSAIVSMSHALGIRVVAEGVEDAEIQSALADMACDTAQGYGICCPQKLDDLVIWYNTYQPHTQPKALSQNSSKTN